MTYWHIIYQRNFVFFCMKVNSGRMHEDEARKYFQQLINTVDYCHSRGVFHRDLKVLNLILWDSSPCLGLEFTLFFFLPNKGPFLFVVYSTAWEFATGCFWKPQSFGFWIECIVSASQGNLNFWISKACYYCLHISSHK